LHIQGGVLIHIIRIACTHHYRDYACGQEDEEATRYRLIHGKLGARGEDVVLVRREAHSMLSNMSTTIIEYRAPRD
jgi:hypothetical protein